MAPSSVSDSPSRRASHGLDRAAFNVYEQAHHHVDDKVEQSGFSNETASSNGKHIPDRINALRVKAKSKTQRLFHQTPEPISTPTKFPTLPCLAPNPTSTKADDRLYNDLPENEGMQAKDLLKSPVSSVQSALHGRGGEKFANIMDNQVIAHGANVKLVRAYDRAETAQQEEDKNSALEEVDTLKKERQDAYVRWTMDRHVLKVRQDPPRSLQRPKTKDFTATNEEGKKQVQWSDYGQQLVRFYAERHLDQHIDESSVLPPASEEAINTSVERLLMTSMAYQTAMMYMRHIYRWDDPQKTALYCGAYFLLLVIGQLCSGIILFMLYLVMSRWFNPPSPETLREDIKRSENTEKSALSITQLIEQHGSRGWLDAAIEKMGPALMIQLEDTADALEIVRNFYEWRDPPRTARTLGVLAACLPILAFCPLWLQVRSSQFIIGVIFFFIFPISSHLPQFRHLVSPFKWTFWGITTDAEWAITRIQAEARQTLAIIRNKDHGNQRDNDARGEDNPATNDNSSMGDVNDKHDSNPSLSIGHPHCTTFDEKKNLHHGHLHITTTEVKFETAIRLRTLWTLAWKDVSTISKARTEDGLCFMVDGEARAEDRMDERKGKGEAGQYCVQALKERDLLFTQIIGYSGLRWQVSD